jgi:LysM repeat protein
MNPTVNSNCTNLQLGELLCLKLQPTTTSFTLAPTPTTYGCYQTYVVNPGDTISSIALSNGVYEAQLLGINQALQASSKLTVGQVLCIRDNTCPACSQTYNVKSGDSCDSIATKIGIPLTLLEDMNPYINSACSNIYGKLLPLLPRHILVLITFLITISVYQSAMIFVLVQVLYRLLLPIH